MWRRFFRTAISRSSSRLLDLPSSYLKIRHGASSTQSNVCTWRASSPKRTCAGFWGCTLRTARLGGRIRLGNMQKVGCSRKSLAQPSLITYTTVRTIEGNHLDIKLSSAGYTVSGSDIRQRDVYAANGVLHT